MILRELLNVLEPTFIAVGYNTDKSISYSGNSKNCDTYFLLDRKVVYIKASNSKTSATIIYVE